MNVVGVNPLLPISACFCVFIDRNNPPILSWDNLRATVKKRADNCMRCTPVQFSARGIPTCHDVQMFPGLPNQEQQQCNNVTLTGRSR